MMQSYLFFYDKLNKCNYFLELSIQHADLPIDDRIVFHTSQDLISDGGQWDMVVNVLEVRVEVLALRWRLTRCTELRRCPASGLPRVPALFCL